MEITREQLEERRAVLEAAAQKLLSDYNAVMGAVQECDHWIAAVTEPEATTEGREK